MKKLKLKSVCFRIFVLLLSIVLIFVVNNSALGNDDALDYIYGTFIGSKSDYNGVIEVWNIDTFEGGYKSKFSFLDDMAKSFQKKNKGVYVVTRNITIGECEYLLSQNELPDIISCSYGVSEKIKDYICSFENYNSKVLNNFIEAGKGNDGDVYGLAWCAGFYSLISTKSKLEKVGVEFENVKLNEIAFTSSYNYNIGKKEKLSKSIIYGTNEYLMPKKALEAYNKLKSIQIEEDLNNEIKLKSQYSAYISFLSNDATILLGTQRDICRMSGRVEKGKMSDVVYLPLMNWTDLVQYSFVCKSDNEQRKRTAEKFACFLTEEVNQKKLEDIGLFPVIEVKDTLLKGVMRDIILENIGDCEVEKIF